MQDYYKKTLFTVIVPFDKIFLRIWICAVLANAGPYKIYEAPTVIMYTIITDSSCDIPTSVLDEWKVRMVSLSVLKTSTGLVTAGFDIDINSFYEEMRQGELFQTSGVNPADFSDLFEEELSAGRDVIYIGFSSALSSTYSTACMVADELSEKYPDRQLYCIDSLGACAGQGLLVYLAVKRRDAGVSLDELKSYVENVRLRINHWFTVDDLKYLRRGGRISATAAKAAAVLTIKPVMHVNDEGRLVGVFNVRGRKRSIKELCDKYLETAENPSSEYIIAHADCLSDAEGLAESIRSYTGRKPFMITNIGAVIGAHAGPGTISIFFVGPERRSLPSLPHPFRKPQ